ncbi:MAG: YndJ family protein [Blastocatellia bacterium]
MKWSDKSAGIGLVIWVLAAISLRPSLFELPWGQLLLLLAALVLIPLALDLLVPRGASRRWRWLVVCQFPAAVLLVASFAMPQGIAAVTLAAPWALITALLSWCGLARAWRAGWRPGDRLFPPDLCVSAGMIFLSIGGAWLIAARAGLRPMGFDPVIVLLTAIHFHYAGFLLPVLTGLAVRRRPDRLARMACLGVMAGVPLTAIGITTTQMGLSPWIETMAAWITVMAGWMAALLHFRLARDQAYAAPARVLWNVMALSLTLSMALAFLYAARAHAPLAWLDIPPPDIPWMRALHGTANAIGFGLCGVLAWRIAMRQQG